MKKIKKIEVKYSQPPKGYIGIYNTVVLPITLLDVIDKINEIIEVLNKQK